MVLVNNCIVFTGTEIIGKEAVVLGRSKIVVRKHIDFFCSLPFYVTADNSVNGHFHMINTFLNIIGLLSSFPPFLHL